MATTLAKLVQNAEKGILNPIEDLAKILNTAEVNELLLEEKLLNEIERLLPKTNTLSIPQRVNSEIALANAQQYSGGYLVEDARTYAYLKRYIDVLNENKPKEDQYQVGHKPGLYTYYLKILQENYNPKLTDISSQELDIISNQKRLIQSALKAAVAIDNLDEKTINQLKSMGLSSGASLNDLKIVLENVNSPIDVEFTGKKDITLSLLSGKSNIILTARFGKHNAIANNLMRTLGNSFKKEFNSNSVDFLGKFFDPTIVEGSPSFIKSITGYLEDVFFNRGKKIKKSASKIRQGRRVPPPSMVYSLKKKIKNRLATLKTKAIAAKSKKKFIIPTVSLKAIINESLQKFIADRMQVSTAPASKAYLRFQTGRFSDSAKLLTLNRQETGAYFGIYTYMKDPYMVFETGYLASPGRDPKLYIEGAIRDIAEITLKNNFKGIMLERN